MRNFTVIFVAVLAACLLGRPAQAQQDIISTLIGGGPNDVPALDADIYGPLQIALDTNGNYYFAAYSANRVFKVDTTGILTVVAGNGLQGYAGDGAAGGATSAQLNNPEGVAVDSSGNVYIGDFGNCVVRKVDTAGTITTIAGVAGQCNYNGDGSPATNFHFDFPSSLALDTLGNLFIADVNNCRIRKLNLASRAISTAVGSTSCGFSGDGGPAIGAQLAYPYGVAVDGSNNIFVADTNNYRIRKVTKTTGKIATVAGTGSSGFSGDGGPATSAQITQVYDGFAVNSAGTTVTIGDFNNYRIRQFTVGGNINTIAGTGAGGFCGDNGPATSACVGPDGIAVTAAGTYYESDYYNYRIRKFTLGGNIATVAGNGSNSLESPVTAIPPNGVVLNYPYAVTADSSGDFWVGDANNYMVRELVAPPTNLVNFFAGTGVYGYSGDSGPALSAELTHPYGVARDSSGNTYIADTNNCIVRKVNTSKVISTFAGIHGQCGYTGDGGLPTSATLNSPASVYVDSSNNVYISDTSNHAIRLVSGGVISTLAGDGRAGYTGDGGPATAAELYYPEQVAKDGAGNVYIADSGNCRIRAVNSAGTIDTVAGIGGSNGGCGFTGDGMARNNELNSPAGIAADANGNLFIADTNNQILRWISPGGVISTFAGTPQQSGFKGDGQLALTARLYYPVGVYEDALGNITVADQYNFRVRQVTAFAGLGASVNSLSFPLTTVGSTSSPFTVTLSGVGTVSILANQITGPFVESDNCPASLSNGQKCTMEVFYKPTASGAQSGSIVIQNSGFFNTAATIALSGTGTAISVTSGAVAFANQAVKTTSAPQSVTVKNTGTAAITMKTIALNETTDFAISANTCPASGSTLAGGASCTISMTFNPQSTGLKKGVLSIGDSDPTSPQLVGVSGTGTSLITFNPSSIVFPTTPLGTVTAVMKTTLTNTSAAALTLGNPAIAVPAPFKLSAGATTCTNGLVVAASGGTCVIGVTFTPTVLGYASATISVTDSSASSPQTVPLSGLGTALKFTPSSLNIGTTTRGSTISAPVTLTNVGTTTISLTAGVISGTHSADFTNNGGEPPCSGSLAAGATCTFSFYFKPSIVGNETATYKVYDNTAGSPQSLPLSGTGQ